MSTSFGPIRKQSAASSQNTRDISISDLKVSISLEECIQLDTASPLKDLDRDGQKIPYSLAAKNSHSTFPLSDSSLSDGFYTKFREQLASNQQKLFQAAKQGRIQEVRAIMREYPIPASVRQARYYDNTLLHQSLRYGHLDISLFLLKMDVGLLNLQNNQGRTPVHFALMHIRQLFLVILDDHLQQIDWSVVDENGIPYDQYVEFYQYEHSVYKRVVEAIGEFGRKNRRVEAKKERPFFCFPADPKKYFSQLAHGPELPKLRHARSHYIERPKRISSLFDIKQNVFSADVGISDFLVISELGEGCFAKVYKVKHVRSGGVFAMKVFEKSKITHQVMKYIISEKNILMRLTHPFLVNAYCSFETPHLYCYVMDCCQGTLKDILNKQKQLSQSKVKAIACQLVSVIGYLHHNGVIYRDLKPDNIGYDETGHIALIDFGLSKDGFTGSSFCGSYLYLPPEMISSQQYNAMVDWYMLGAVLYELSTGKTPFMASDKQGLVQKIMREKPKQLSGVSLQMVDFIDGLLEKNHANRLGVEEDCHELMQHPWFDDIEWGSIPKRRYKIPFSPTQLLNHKKPINQNAETYFQGKVSPKTEFDFIEVARWASVKELH